MIGNNVGNETEGKKRRKNLNLERWTQIAWHVYIVVFYCLYFAYDILLKRTEWKRNGESFIAKIILLWN